MIGQKQKPATDILTTSLALSKDGGVSNILPFPYGYDILGETGWCVDMCSLL